MKLIEVILCFSQTIKAKSFLPCDDVLKMARIKRLQSLPISRIIVK